MAVGEIAQGKEDSRRQERVWRQSFQVDPVVKVAEEERSGKCTRKELSQREGLEQEELLDPGKSFRREVVRNFPMQ